MMPPHIRPTAGTPSSTCRRSEMHGVYTRMKITQELLQQACERFRVRGARILRASTEGGKA